MWSNETKFDMKYNGIKLHTMQKQREQYSKQWARNLKNNDVWWEMWYMCD